MEKLIMTPTETAKALQTRKETVQRLIEEGQIPAYREGRNWKIPTKALEEYILNRAERERISRLNDCQSKDLSDR